MRLWGRGRELALFEFLIDTGVRLGEGLRANPKDLSLSPRRITLWDTKNGRHRAVPLTRRALAAFQQGPGFGDINVWALRSLWDRLRTHLPWLDDATIHTFRHTCISRLVQRGVDLMRVKEWAGHTAIATTMRYSHLTPKHLDEALSVLEAAE